MFQIDDKIISRAVFETYFECDLSQCKGNCCVEGESGAPLEEDELPVLEAVYPLVEPYLTEKGKAVIKKHGKWIIDSDGDFVTPLINGRECAYYYRENGITYCAIEKAYFEKKIDFRKPVSCHLFPIRIKEYSDFTAVNYEEVKICASACRLGEQKKMPVFRFLKEPLIRKFGENFYVQLETLYAEYPDFRKS